MMDIYMLSLVYNIYEVCYSLVPSALLQRGIFLRSGFVWQWDPFSEGLRGGDNIQMHHKIKCFFGFGVRTGSAKLPLYPSASLTTLPEHGSLSILSTQRNTCACSSLLTRICTAFSIAWQRGTLPVTCPRTEREGQSRCTGRL